MSDKINSPQERAPMGGGTTVHEFVINVFHISHFNKDLLYRMVLILNPE